MQNGNSKLSICDRKSNCLAGASAVAAKKRFESGKLSYSILNLFRVFKRLSRCSCESPPIGSEEPRLCFRILQTDVNFVSKATKKRKHYRRVNEKRAATYVTTLFCTHVNPSNFNSFISRQIQVEENRRGDEEEETQKQHKGVDVLRRFDGGLLNLHLFRSGRSKRV